ncbi:hypothetical protein GH714_031791 [Hevea brasiliensis]|uniref:Retrotransposon gag domain-containing protein n=1 Tax=Hevea brasiliensis TaxID=3981 RepID=A0A6A6N406_HEVBR|nr:hypothetical protein GH714_031791 [Hevea brasiliensis]
MTNLANQLDALERRVDDAFALIDNYPTYEALTKELKVVRLSLEQRNKHVEVLEEKVEQFVAVVAKLIGGKLKIVPMYLANDAKLWWRTKVEQSISSQCSTVTWDDFKKALKAKFYPENVAYNARCKLAELQHTGSIREYGLKPWARNELVRRGVKELSTALAAAESLDDYTINASKRKFNSLPGSDNRPNKWGRNSSGGVDWSNSTFGGTERRTWNSRPNTNKPMSQNREQDNSRQGNRNGISKESSSNPVPVADCISLMGDKPCTIPTSFSPISEKKLLSALQFKKGVKRREPSYVVVPIVKEGGKAPLFPPQIQDVMAKFQDVMLE